MMDILKDGLSKSSKISIYNTNKDLVYFNATEVLLIYHMFI